MTDKSSELMNISQLDNVTGGNGAESIHFLSELRDRGYYKPDTPLVAGYEEDAAKELQKYLMNLNGKSGAIAFKGTKIYSDNRDNEYMLFGKKVDMNKMLNHIRVVLKKDV